ncbi:MAG: hypothetical protein ACAI34_03475 [Verrucomicrobium sp.]
MPANLTLPRRSNRPELSAWVLDKALGWVFRKYAKGALANHKTTLAGVGSILAGLGSLVQLLMGWSDGGEVHFMDLAEVIGFISLGFTGIFARDYDKTSKGELAVIDGHVIPKALPVAE